MLRTLTFTLTGAAESIYTTNVVPVGYVKMESETGNADVKVGVGTSTAGGPVSATNYGFILEAGPTKDKEIGPFGGGECPFNLGEIWVLGTGGQKIHITYITL